MNENERLPRPARCSTCQVWADLNSAGNCDRCANAYSGSTIAKPTQKEQIDVDKDTKTFPRANEVLPEAPAGYTLIDEIGQGGMGLVYRALERGSSRVVAIKYMSTRVHRSAKERFEREVQALANLQHKALVPIYSVNLEARDPYFMMEYLVGGSLSRRLRRGRLAPEEAAHVIASVARGLAVAHAAGILHRDLKPSNILLDEHDNPKIADFGLAKHLDHLEPQGLTQTQSLIGTPTYMSPEQAERRHVEVDQRADIYSLGATLYECLTGHPPFMGETTAETLAQVRLNRPISPSAYVPGLAQVLEAICLRCLEKNPARRYDSANALADDLERWLQGLPTNARPPRLPVKLWRRVERHSRLITMLGAMLLLVPFSALLDFTCMRSTDAMSSAPAILQKEQARPTIEVTEKIPQQLIPAPEFAPDRDEEMVRKMLRAGDTIELVDDRGPRVPLVQGFGGAQIVYSPNRDTPFSLFTRESSVLLLMQDPGIERYRLRMEVRQDLKMRDLQAEWPSGYASVGFALGFTRASTPEGVAFSSLNMIGLTDQNLPDAQTSDVGLIQVEAQVLATKPLETARTAGHSLHRIPLSELPVEAKTRPWRYFQVDVTPEGVTLHSEGQKIFKPASDLRRGVGWRTFFPDSALNKYSSSSIQPDWNTRSPFGIWCRGSWASIRRIIIGPLP